MTWATISPPRSRRLARVPLRYLARLPVRVRDRHFWYVQILLVAVTAFHTFMELRLPSGRYHGLKEMAVILYLLPMAYASLLYGWEGTLLTGLGAAVLATPNIIFLHRGEFEWAAELVEVAVVVVAGTLLARQVEVEAKLRRAAEEATRRLALSEAEYKDLFENAADAILVFADDGTIVSANPASSTLTDFPP
ncbi:MAG: hypothetical protein M1274_11750, partial [Actinobacteria bacterium]|nr:hypothetical protein [Actinomycetota bacterium]